MMPSSRERPILEYVHSLEDRIRKYQREGVRISRMVFVWGFLTGSFLISVIWMVYRWKGMK